MSRRPAKANEWVPLRIESWRKNTRKLSAEERGCYMDLLLEYWDTQGPLIYDAVDFSNICGLSLERWLEIESRILRFFDKKDGKLHNKRMDEEMEKANRLFKKKQAAGRIGGIKSGQSRSKKEADASIVLEKTKQNRSKQGSNGAAELEAMVHTRAGIGQNPEGEGRSVAPLAIQDGDEEMEKCIARIENVARRSVAAKNAAQSGPSQKLKGV